MNDIQSTEAFDVIGKEASRLDFDNQEDVHDRYHAQDIRCKVLDVISGHHGIFEVEVRDLPTTSR